MNKANQDMEDEYDLSSLGEGTKGKYFKKYNEGTNVVVIDPDLSVEFPNTKAVNDALREYLEHLNKSSS